MGRVRLGLWVTMALLVSLSASADWVGVSTQKAVNASDQSIIRHEWTSSATDSTTYDVSSCTAGIEVRFDPSTGDSSTDATFQIGLCNNSTDTAAYCRKIGWAGTGDGSTWYGINAVTQGENYILVDALTATTGGDTARVEVRCTGRASQQTGIGGAETQPVPSMATYSTSTNGSISNPNTATFGYGLEFGSLTEFTDGKTYNGGSTQAIEPDNQLGVFYNKALNESPDNIYEHAFDKSWELSYYASATNDEPWVEENWDVYAPDMSATLTSIGGGFNPAVGSYVTFSGGGTGRVLVWSNPTLTWRQVYGKTAAGETVAEAATPTDTATLGAPAVSTTYQAFRPELHVWRTVTGKASHQWSTEDGGPITMKLQNGGVGVNTDDQISATFEVHGANSWGRDVFGALTSSTAYGGGAADGYPAFWVQYEGELHPTSGNTGAEAQWNRMDYTSLASAAFVVDYGKALTIKTPLESDNENDVYQAFGLYIESQRAAGSNHGAAIFIAPQTCRANAACSGLGTPDGWHNNLEFGGGNWSTGHLSFQGGADYSSGHDTGDHIWRDDTNEVFRASTDDAPDSETDGRAIVTASNSAVYGPTMWAISNGGTFDTGDEVCQASGVGMTCQDVLEFSTPANPTDSTCATAHANAVKFLAMCK